MTDHLGTVRDVVYHNGSAVIIAQHNELDAFGRLLSTPTVETLALYTGRFYDMVTGLQYNRARWYDASVGRWMSTDPIGFEAADANLYRYVGNGVMFAVDPEGLEDDGWGVWDVLMWWCGCREPRVTTQDWIDWVNTTASTAVPGSEMLSACQGGGKMCLINAIKKLERQMRTSETPGNPHDDDVLAEKELQEKINRLKKILNENCNKRK